MLADHDGLFSVAIQILLMLWFQAYLDLKTHYPWSPGFTFSYNCLCMWFINWFHALLFIYSVAMPNFLFQTRNYSTRWSNMKKQCKKYSSLVEFNLWNSNIGLPVLWRCCGSLVNCFFMHLQTINLFFHI